MNHLIEKILSPEKHLSTTVGLILGLATTLVLGIFGFYSQVALDGAFDLHQTKEMSMTLSLTMNIINWFCISVCFFLIAKMLQSKIRLIDFVGIVGTIKLWYIFPLLFIYFLSPEVNVGDIKKGIIAPSIILSGLISMAFSILFLVQLFYAYKTNSNLRGRKLIVSFIVGIFISELLSKIILSQTHNF